MTETHNPELLERRLVYRFRNRQHLLEALTHRSYANEAADAGVKDYERLEFLGDAVLLGRELPRAPRRGLAVLGRAAHRQEHRQRRRQGRLGRDLEADRRADRQGGPVPAGVPAAAFGPSILHGLIGWGFIIFLVVNLNDLVYGYTSFSILNSTGVPGNLYRLLADIANAAIIIRIIGMVIRRFILRPATLTTRDTTLLHPKARFGILRDSAIVASFIFIHNAARFLGESFKLAAEGVRDSWQPVVSAAASLWAGSAPGALVIGEHIMFWASLGAVLASRSEAGRR